MAHHYGVTEDTISGCVSHGIFNSVQKEVVLGNCCLVIGEDISPLGIDYEVKR